MRNAEVEKSSDALKFLKYYDSLTKSERRACLKQERKSIEKYLQSVATKKKESGVAPN
jgi:hypothetical protein